MAAESSPAFSFYVRDWIADVNVRAMTNEARGVYIDLLALCWQEGTLPRDPAQLKKIARLTAAEFRRIWPQLEPCFTLTPDGYQQKRLELERGKQRAHKAAVSQRGTAGANARWRKSPAPADADASDPQCSSNARAMLPIGFASSSSSSIKDQEQRASARTLDPPRSRAARKVLARLVYELPDLEASEADKKAELKILAVRYGLSYDAGSITGALDANEAAGRRRRARC
jgi:uncharacterized protein YdaU (DUF1376 family)